MKFLSSAAVLFAFTITANIYAADASKVIKLEKAETAFGVENITPLDGGKKLCVTGTYIDTDEIKQYGEIVLVDTEKKAILWQKKVPAPEGVDENFFEGCKSVGTNLFVLANVNTNNSPPLNQQLVYIYKFGEDGKQMDVKLDIQGRDTYAYDLEANDNGLQIVGYAMDGKDSSRYSSLFVQNFDTNLKFDKPILYKTGAYEYSAAAKIKDNTVYIGGYFTKYKSADGNDHDDYANSRIRIGGPYMWSVRPQHKDFQTVFSAIAEDGTIYAFGSKDKITHFTAVDTNGKVVTDQTLSTSLCETRSVATTPNNLYVVREDCKTSGKAVLVSIDPKSAQEHRIKDAPANPEFIHADQATLDIVYKDTNGNQMLQLMPIDGSTQ